MNFPFYIARRYLVSRKTHNIINIISAISVVGVMVGTMALVIVLSVFNGFEKVVVSMFNIFDPDLEISLKEGKTFKADDIPANAIRSLPEIVKYTDVLEENALLRFRDKQFLATIKGVSNEYLNDSPLDTLLVEGDLILQSDSFDFALPGFGIAYYLNIHVDDPDALISVYVPDRTKRLNVISESNLRNESIRPAGIFSVQQDFDNKYMIVPLRFARKLLNYENQVSKVEILLEPGTDIETVQSDISKLVGPKFEVKNRLQQQELLYKTMKSEKWAVFLILTFILIVATFNVIGSITMLILDKQNDIHTLESLGANRVTIKKIFFTEGLLITLSGALSGLILGGLVCWLQMEYGLIRLQGGGSFVMTAYPVQMKALDFLMVFVTVVFIGAASSFFAIQRLGRRFAL